MQTNLSENILKKMRKHNQQNESNPKKEDLKVVSLPTTVLWFRILDLRPGKTSYGVGTMCPVLSVWQLNESKL